MTLNSPTPVEFNSIKQLINRFYENRETHPKKVISVDDLDVPSWQRDIVWTDEEKGLLAYSIIQNYPIGMIVLWRKENGIRVPIDGRQRLYAIRAFYEGKVAIPSLIVIPESLRNKKYKLNERDSESGFSLLDLEQREIFDDYNLSMVFYDDISEVQAMDIFVKLQGGKRLTKTEIRAALGGRLCDFVTQLTSNEPSTTDEDDDNEEEVRSRHPFFQKIHLKNIRKSHRNLCDVLLHEYLYPGQDKHWSSLEKLYLEKATTLTDNEIAEFKSILGRFQRGVEYEEDRRKIIPPQLKSVFLILSYFKAWRDIYENYNTPTSFSFSKIVRDFETQRIESPDDIPNIKFREALSNAGYSEHRIETRHDVLMTYIFQQFPEITPKDRDRRAFTDSQKIAIWERAGHRCEWTDENGKRCEAAFQNYREADADHIIKWENDGPTSIANGRLLCRLHNRGRRD